MASERRTAVLLVLAALLTLIGHIALAQELKPQTIYGADGRRDFYQLRSEKLKTLARKSVALVSSKYIPNSKSALKTLKGDKYGSSSNLCSDERFYGQPSVAFCSGVLISNRYVLTAGHCIKESACATTNFVLDFMITDEYEQGEVSVALDNIYACAGIAQRVVTKTLDFAIVELDRPVRDRRSVPLTAEAKAVVDDSLVTIGFPSGIPLKISLDGRLRYQTANYISASLDVLSGNSGSPVYNSKMELVGILLRGEADYQFDRSNKCYLDRRCEEGKCMGETILKTATILKNLKPEIFNAHLNIY